jgi:hypothetical protein
MKNNIKLPEQLVNDFFSNVWHKPHNLKAIDNLMTEDYKITTAGSIISGRENFKSWVERSAYELFQGLRDNSSNLFV